MKEKRGRTEEKKKGNERVNRQPDVPLLSKTSVVKKKHKKTLERTYRRDEKQLERGQERVKRERERETASSVPSFA